MSEEGQALAVLMRLHRPTCVSVAARNLGAVLPHRCAQAVVAAAKRRVSSRSLRHDSGSQEQTPKRPLSSQNKESGSSFAAQRQVPATALVAQKRKLHTSLRSSAKVRTVDKVPILAQ